MEIGDATKVSIQDAKKAPSGHRLGNYFMQEELGEGGMATLYRGKHAFLDRSVAIKELKSRFRRDGEVQDRFLREGKVAASLPHRNIVQVYDFWRDRDHRYLVMELVDGLDLAALLQRTGALPLHVALAVVGQVCEGVSFAHSRGIIHRDLKPSNLFITREGVAKVGDFGVVHLMGASQLTQPGLALGTFSYMSPEQIRGEHLTPASDVFSLGVVLYELLTGRRPFVDDDTDSVTAKILSERPTPPRQINRGISRPVQRIVLRCLRKQPNRRFRSCTALQRAIARIIDGKPAKWEALIHRYVQLLPAEGKVPHHLGRNLRVSGHFPRRLRRLVLVTGLMVAAILGVISLGSVNLMVSSTLTWAETFFPPQPVSSNSARTR